MGDRTFEKWSRKSEDNGRMDDMINGLLVDTHCIPIIYTAHPLTALVATLMNACNVIFASPTPERGQSLGKFSE